MSISDIWKRRVIPFFLKNEKNIIFGVSLLLVSIFSFELGTLYTIQGKNEVLVIEKPTVSLAQMKKDAGITEEGKVAGAEATENGKRITENKEKVENVSLTECLFVGSKNSDKYHSPSCSYAKRIKPENVVCFKSKEDAEGRGYTAGCIQ